MVLLHALKTLSRRHSWKLVVAHFNHRLRARASDADERLVRKTAAAMKLPLAAGGADVKAFAAKSKLSLEMAARKLRHEFLALAARKRTIETIALAHHAGDQVELFFLRLLRGAGGEGLAGMKWRSPSPANPGITLARPLLGCAKSELLAVAHKNKIRFREDASNLSTDFLRNRIRNQLLPLLRKQYQPALDRTVLRLMEIAGAEAEIVSEAARHFPRSRGDEAQAKSGKRKAEIGNEAEPPYVGYYDFKRLPVAIQRRVLQRQLTERGLAAEFELIESLRRMPNQFISVGPKISVVRAESGDIKLRMESEPEFKASELAVNLTNRKREAIFGGVELNWQFQTGSRGRSPHQNRTEFFDADKVGGKIVLRHWRAGDRFQPIGMKSAVKLQDLFTNAKISRDRRRKLVLAEAASGAIFWVEGLRIGERFKLTPQTARTLVWGWSKSPA